MAAIEYYDAQANGYRSVGPAVILDTDQLGTIKVWSRSVIPDNWVLADGASYSRMQYPDCYAIAVEEVAAGNQLWTVDTTGQTFTVPDLSERFLYAPSSGPLGDTGGEASHLLTTQEMPAHGHNIGPDPNASPSFAPQVNLLQETGTLTYPGWAVTIAGTSGGYRRVVAGTAGGGQAHNNMPPYISVAFIIKIKGAEGGPGNGGGESGVGYPFVEVSTDPPDPNVPQSDPPMGYLWIDPDADAPGSIPNNGTVGQVLGKRSDTDYDIGWVDQTGSGGAGVYTGDEAPDDPEEYPLWIDPSADSGGSVPLIAPADLDSPPYSTPYEGQIVDVIVDSTNWIMWRLRYNTSVSDAYKWMFVGGASLSAYNAGPTGGVTGNAWAATQPVIAVPRPGIYHVTMSAAAVNNANAAATAYFLADGSSVPLTSALLGISAYALNLPATAGSMGTVVQNARTRAMASGEQIRTIVAANSPTVFQQLSMAALPVRVS